MENLTTIPARNEVASAFDEIADRYDAAFESSPVTQRLRKKIYSIVQSLVPSGGSILDINCGTGTDARYLASLGYHTVGTDISAKMIKQAKRKSFGMPHIEFHVGSFHNLSSVTTAKFDLVLSNFGGLNCTDNLTMVAEGMSPLLWPNGYLVAIIMPPFSLWEFLSHGIRGNWRRATRRLNGKANAAGFQDNSFTVNYHSPSTIRSAFASHFEVTSLIGLNIISPPQSAKTFLQSYPRFSKALEKCDALVESVPIVRALGDHYIIVLRRKRT